MVISGADYRPEQLKPKEVVSLLLDDEEMEKKCEQPPVYRHLPHPNCHYTHLNCQCLILTAIIVFTPNTSYQHRCQA